MTLIPNIQGTDERQQNSAFPDVLTRYRPAIINHLRDEYRDLDSGLYQTHTYFLGFSDPHGNRVDYSKDNGKALRPTLALIGCDAVDGDIERSMPAAIAMELIHNFSLIHDDIQDGDRFRHNRLAVWVVFGKPAGLISGVGMLKVAERSIRKLESKGVLPEVVNRVQVELTSACLKMIEGQFFDISFESRRDVSVDEYLTMISLKTGALIETSLVVGALTGPLKPNERTCEGLRSLGRVYGRLFQIQDDVLGVWGNSETGKPVGADIKGKKKSLPILHALGHEKADRMGVLGIFEKEQISNADVEDMLAIMDDINTKQWCAKVMKDCWLQGRELVNSLLIRDDTRKDLTDLGEFLLTRVS